MCTTYAPTTGPVLYTPNEYIVVRCDVHGTKVTRDFDSFRAYVVVARECSSMAAYIPNTHAAYHHVSETDCWVDDACCVVDPHGMFD